MFTVSRLQGVVENNILIYGSKALEVLDPAVRVPGQDMIEPQSPQLHTKVASVGSHWRVRAMQILQVLNPPAENRP